VVSDIQRWQTESIWSPHVGAQRRLASGYRHAN
jgi:hypothetical protein